jgi:hypothetical protein
MAASVSTILTANARICVARSRQCSGSLVSPVDVETVPTDHLWNRMEPWQEQTSAFEALENKARSRRPVDFYKESDYKQHGDWGAIHDNRSYRR